jgi:hypothetical protein
MDRIKKHQNELLFLSKCKKNIRSEVVNKGSRDLIASICEIVDNLLNNKIKLSPEQFEKLKPYRASFRKLVSKTTLDKKKKIISQKGGFLEFIIPAVITALGSIISNAISSD